MKNNNNKKKKQNKQNKTTTTTTTRKNKTNKKKQQQQQQTNISSHSRAFLEEKNAPKIQVKFFRKCPKWTHFPVKPQTISLKLN